MNERLKISPEIEARRLASIGGTEVNIEHGHYYFQTTDVDPKNKAGIQLTRLKPNVINAVDELLAGLPLVLTPAQQAVGEPLSAEIKISNVYREGNQIERRLTVRFDRQASVRLAEKAQGQLSVNVGRSALYELPKPAKIGNGKVSTVFFQFPH